MNAHKLLTKSATFRPPHDMLGLLVQLQVAKYKTNAAKIAAEHEEEVRSIFMQALVKHSSNQV